MTEKQRNEKGEKSTTETKRGQKSRIGPFGFIKVQKEMAEAVKL